MVAFVLYSYLVLPFKNMTKDTLNSVTVVLLFIVFVMADSSYLSYDVSRAVKMPHASYEGVLVEYEGRRGLGTPHIVVSDGNSKHFKLLTVRGKGSHQLLERQLGKKMQVTYIQSKGLLTRWNLPVHIRLSTSELVYDYRNHLDWFENPALPVDKIIIALFRIMVFFSLVYFPINCMRCLSGQEVRHELDQHLGIKPGNTTES